MSAFPEPLSSLPRRLKADRSIPLDATEDERRSHVDQIVNDISQNLCLEEIYLANNDLNDRELAKILGCLQNLHVLTRLDLSNSAFGKEGAEHMARYLSSNTSLHHLNLDDAFGNGSAVQFLAEGLKQNSTLKSLSLRVNTIQSEQALAITESAIQGRALSTLDFGWNMITTEGCIKIAKLLLEQGSSVTQLSLEHNVLADREKLSDLVDLLFCNTSLRKLYFGQGVLLNQDLTIISQGLSLNTTLTMLDLWSNTFVGADLVFDTVTPPGLLTALLADVDSEQPDGLTMLTDSLLTNTTLSSLTLRNMDLMSNGGVYFVQNLAQNSFITNLNLISSNVESGLASKLADSLTKNQALTSLNLSHNPVGCAGTVKLFEGLAANTTLTDLNLTDCCIGLDGVESIANYLSSDNALLQSLHMQQSFPMGTLEFETSQVSRIADSLHGNTVLISLAPPLGAQSSVKSADFLALFNCFKVNGFITHVGLRKDEQFEWERKAVKGLARRNFYNQTQKTISLFEMMLYVLNDI